MDLLRQSVHESTFPRHQTTEARKGHVRLRGHDLDHYDRVRFPILLEYVG